MPVLLRSMVREVARHSQTRLKDYRNQCASAGANKMALMGANVQEWVRSPRRLWARIPNLYDRHSCLSEADKMNVDY
jgi:hypothetical protein